MLNFTFHNPTTIHFGSTKVKVLEGELKKYASRLLVVYGRNAIKSNGIYNEIIKIIKTTAIPYWELSGIQPNPRLSTVYQGIELCKKHSIDFVLAIGGGSVIDASKAIAAGALYDGNIWECFEKHSGPSKALPIGTVLTLAATGSEMNGNTVITNEDTNQKRACGSPVLMPVFSILNPEYTFSVDPYNTAAGIADIMAHIFETYLSPIKNSPIQNRLSEALLRTCIEDGPMCCSQPNNYDARANIMWASTLALNGFIGKGKISDWTLHALEHELSGIYDIPHGVGLAILLPPYMKTMLNEDTKSIFYNYGTTLWSIDKNKDLNFVASEAIDKTQQFLKNLGLPTHLSELNIDCTHFDEIANSTLKTRGKVGHYDQLTKEQLLGILKMAL